MERSGVQVEWAEKRGGCLPGAVREDLRSVEVFLREKLRC